MSILDSFTKLAAEVWRKYVTAGVPASGLHSPDLDEITQWGDDVEAAFNALAEVSITRVVTVAGAATVGATDGCLVIKKTVGAATNVNIPAAASRFGLDVVIKDGKGDANTNAITPVFNGAESCDGVTGAALQITTPYGFLRMRPYPDGSGYFQLESRL